MKWKVLITFAFSIELNETLPGNNVALERTNLSLVQEFFSGLILATNARNNAIAAKDATLASQFVGIAAKAQQAYFAARDKRIQGEIALGRLRPQSAWQASLAALALVKSIVDSQEEIAAQLNPEDPQRAVQGLRLWREGKFDAGVRSAIGDIEASGGLAA